MGYGGTPEPPQSRGPEPGPGNRKPEPDPGAGPRSRTPETGPRSRPPRSRAPEPGPGAGNQTGGTTHLLDKANVDGNRAGMGVPAQIVAVEGYFLQRGEQCSVAVIYIGKGSFRTDILIAQTYHLVRGGKNWGRKKLKTKKTRGISYLQVHGIDDNLHVFDHVAFSGDTGRPCHPCRCRLQTTEGQSQLAILVRQLIG